MKTLINTVALVAVTAVSFSFSNTASAQNRVIGGWENGHVVYDPFADLLIQAFAVIVLEVSEAVPRSRKRRHSQVAACLPVGDHHECIRLRRVNPLQLVRPTRLVVLGQPERPGPPAQHCPAVSDVRHDRPIADRRDRIVGCRPEHVENQHRVWRHDRAAGLGNDVGVRDLGGVARVSSFAAMTSDKISYGGWVKPTGTSSGAILARMDDHAGFRGYDILLSSGKPGNTSISS